MRRRSVSLAFLAGLVVALATLIASAPRAMEASANGTVSQEEAPASGFVGMDQSVNTELAAEAGRPARDPYINVETWGELWNLLLLLGGGTCGFILGRHWDQLWGKPR